MGSIGHSSAPPSFLFAFDFDHTIVDGNTDTHIIQAHPEKKLPAEIKQSYLPGRWTEYMQRVLAHLHHQGVSEADMQQVLEQLPYTPGMHELLQELQAGSINGQPCSCIILSDSNSVFIEWILASRGHKAAFSHIYTNPAHLTAEQGLMVSPFHSHSCEACPVNMCKRDILLQHQQLSAAQPAPRVVYVGDGGNDLCPAQSLGPSDFLMVRTGYALDKLLQDPAVLGTISAQVHRWSDASEIVRLVTL